VRRDSPTHAVMPRESACEEAGTHGVCTPSPPSSGEAARGERGGRQSHAHELASVPLTPTLSPQERGERADCRNEIAVAGVTLAADLAGALYWPDERLLVVSDLHLEKGSSFAARGVLLPPYDTAATLERLAAVLSRYSVRTVVALGDNFHDPGGPARLAAADRATLSALQRGRDWIWIAGNHDPDIAPDLAGRIGGASAEALALGPLVFRHEPASGTSPGEIAGHLHPVARISLRGHALTRRCFASDGARLVMPAFGAYTGGLDIRHAAFAPVFGGRNFTAHLIGQRRIYAFAARQCADGGA
jgi:DNA ligase-associated metallophosphoesterase